MTEKGSDHLFAELDDVSEIGRRARLEQVRLRVEEWRLRTVPLPAVDDEPGDDHPDPDEAPPAGEPHPEFDPTPPT
jgi:hypothetical protein